MKTLSCAPHPSHASQREVPLGRCRHLPLVTMVDPCLTFLIYRQRYIKTKMGVKEVRSANNCLETPLQTPLERQHVLFCDVMQH